MSGGCEEGWMSVLFEGGGAGWTWWLLEKKNISGEKPSLKGLVYRIEKLDRGSPGDVV
jgi:hypothetical protein